MVDSEEDWSPVKLFELFFDDNIVQYIAESSELYAQQKGNYTFSIDMEECQVDTGHTDDVWSRSTPTAAYVLGNVGRREECCYQRSHVTQSIPGYIALLACL